MISENRFFISPAMKNIITFAIAAFLVIGAVACKKHKAVTSTADATPPPATPVATTTVTMQDSTLPMATGTVSHKYKGSCRSVIVTTGDDGAELVLIPKDALGTFDVDGKTVKFNYQLLRMPLPEGCTVGKMAAITNISE
jgi:hypothetical protein